MFSLVTNRLVPPCSEVVGLALQESGNITQMGLTSVIEESAPEILSLAGTDLLSGVGYIKLAWDVAQFAYAWAKCAR